MTNNPLFTTQLPSVFTVAIDYTQGTQITVNSDLVFKTEYKEDDSLNFCLLAWANHQ